MTKEAEVHGEINNDVTVLTSDVEVERGPYKSGKKAVRINKHLPDSVDLSCIPEDCPGTFGFVLCVLCGFAILLGTQNGE